MAHKKGGGSSTNGRDSNAQRLGVKAFGGELVTGGVRANFKSNSKAKFYGQVTGGLSHFPSESQFVLDFGGGVVMPLEGKNFSLFAQVDFPVVFFGGSAGTSTGFRLNVGGVFAVHGGS